jgi:hypothetical protein
LSVKSSIAAIDREIQAQRSGTLRASLGMFDRVLRPFSDHSGDRHDICDARMTAKMKFKKLGKAREP